MNLITLLTYSTFGTGLWAGVLAYLRRLLGKNYDKANQYSGPVVYIVLGLIVVTLIGL